MPRPETQGIVSQNSFPLNIFQEAQGINPFRNFIMGGSNKKCMKPMGNMLNHKIYTYETLGYTQLSIIHVLKGVGVCRKS